MFLTRMLIYEKLPMKKKKIHSYLWEKKTGNGPSYTIFYVKLVPLSISIHESCSECWSREKSWLHIRRAGGGSGGGRGGMGDESTEFYKREI